MLKWNMLLCKLGLIHFSLSYSSSFVFCLVYEQGKGVEKDPKLAMAKLKEAADLGSVQAKVRLEQDKIRGQ